MLFTPLPTGLAYIQAEQCRFILGNDLLGTLHLEGRVDLIFEPRTVNYKSSAPALPGP